MPKVSPEHLEARRQQILDSATRCFARSGIHGATMQDIVAESGLSPGAIYRYFAGKDQIIEAIASRRHARERVLLDELDRVEDLPGLARQLLGRLEEDVEWQDRLVGIELWAEAVREPRLLQVVKRGNDLPRERIAAQVAEAQAAGRIPAEIDADATARLAIAAFYGFVLQRAWARAAGRDLDAKAYLAVIEWLAGRLTGSGPGAGGE